MEFSAGQETHVGQSDGYKGKQCHNAQQKSARGQPETVSMVNTGMILDNFFKKCPFCKNCGRSFVEAAMHMCAVKHFKEESFTI